MYFKLLAHYYSVLDHPNVHDIYRTTKNKCYQLKKTFCTYLHANNNSLHADAIVLINDQGSLKAYAGHEVRCWRCPIGTLLNLEFRWNFTKFIRSDEFHQTWWTFPLISLVEKGDDINSFEFYWLFKISYFFSKSELRFRC